MKTSKKHYEKANFIRSQIKAHSHLNFVVTNLTLSYFIESFKLSYNVLSLDILSNYHIMLHTGHIIRVS